MCPNNVTNLQDGSDDCDVPIIPGTNLKMRYAVIVSFGVYLNGTNLDDVASKAWPLALLHCLDPVNGMHICCYAPSVCRLQSERPACADICQQGAQRWHLICHLWLHGP